MVKKGKIDLKGLSGYVDGEEDGIIRKELERRGLYSGECLYSFFNRNKKNQVRETGSYRKEDPDEIFALKVDELVWEEIGNPNSVRTMVELYDGKASLAVYDMNCFYNPENGPPFEYTFIDSRNKVNALLGILDIEID